MKHHASVTAGALAVAAAVALAGCANGTPQTSGTPASTSAAATATDISADHGSSDVLFAQMMIPHHQQAVQMSQTLLSKDGIAQEVRDVAERIVAAQGPEIEQMNRMLQAWGQPAVTESDAMGMNHGMMSDGAGNGMMSDEQMGHLRGASGTDAARIYLEQMIMHHRGAVVMAQNEVDNGQNPQAVALAQNIIAAQIAEIEEMDGMLKELPNQ